MVLYKCPRCHYTTNMIPNFRKHLNRKNPCLVSYDNISIADLQKQYGITKSSDPPVCACHGHDSNIGDLLKSILNCLAEIKSEPKCIIQQNIQHNNIIMINDFGKEDTSYLTSDFIENCIMNLNKGMTNLIKEIHFNPGYPQNHNIKLNSKKHALLEKRIDGQWMIVDKSGFIDDIVKKGHRLLHTYYISNDEFKNKIDNNYTSVVEWMNNLMYKMPNVVHPLKRDIFALILNNHMMLFESSE